MKTSESTVELTKALIKFHALVGNIKKSANNPFFKSSYAPLNEVLGVIAKPLQESGLTFVQFPSGRYELTTRLMHMSGEYMEASFKMPPAKEDPQGHGSVITYQRRYALTSILGLNDGDDDGNAASRPQQRR